MRADTWQVTSEGLSVTHPAYLDRDNEFQIGQPR